MATDPAPVLLTVEYLPDLSLVRGADISLPIRDSLRGLGIPAYLVDITEPLPESPSAILFPVVEQAASGEPSARRLAERNGMALVGSNHHRASCVNDKQRTLNLLADAGLTVAEGFSASPEAAEQARDIGFPVVVKPRFGGGSIGVRVARDLDQYLDHLGCLKAQGITDCRIESYLPGTECSLWLVERPGQEPLIGGVSFWRGAGEIFDRRFKTSDGPATDSGGPIRLPQMRGRAGACPVFRAALDAHRLLGLTGYSRTDLVVVDGEPVLIEVNATPTLSETGALSPATALGSPFGEIMRQLVTTAEVPCSAEAFSGPEGSA